MGISSTNGVADHLKAIERKGWISRRPLVARSIRLLDEPDLLAEANARAELWEKRARALGWSDPNRIKPP